ncbi:hypothetical protein PGH26_00070 [Sporosarcina jeotgali]|uniref:Uncharacterized protein n=1 Tax=Sporosarcina jeotgali TaxID=3020056 RepID=A0ABZ0KWX1_9BACL|nr:hypothetical protein [Sporosarcina sp. B2O-1]WOV84378.1 hypothetical protein PGH26_00070 [Sporosarcina sp. B2O-1]
MILIVVGIIACLTFVIPAFLAVTNGKKRKPPRIISYVVGGLLIFHWIFFLVNGYALLPPSIADAVFTPIWLALCLAGAITAISEFMNNKIIAIPMAGLTIISLLFTVLSYGISN